MYRTLPAQLSFVLMLAVCGYALWKGRTSHRVVAAIVGVPWIVTSLIQHRTDWLSTHWWIFGVDTVLALAVTAAALRWRRSWIYAVAAFTWLQVMTHLAMALDDRIRARGYATALYFWANAQLVVLAWAVWDLRNPGERPFTDKPPRA